jgi:hypothetical protein
MIVLLFSLVWAEECFKNMNQSLLALELFIQDKKDHANFCSKISWDQPPLEVYKKDSHSYLPLACYLYVEDKRTAESFCSDLKWEQPSLETYQKTSNTHLPPKCLKAIPLEKTGE